MSDHDWWPGIVNPEATAALEAMWAAYLERLYAPLTAPSPFPPRGDVVLADVFPPPRVPDVPEDLRVDGGGGWR